MSTRNSTSITQQEEVSATQRSVSHSQQLSDNADRKGNEEHINREVLTLVAQQINHGDHQTQHDMLFTVNSTASSASEGHQLPPPQTQQQQQQHPIMMMYAAPAEAAGPADGNHQRDNDNNNNNNNDDPGSSSRSFGIYVGSAADESASVFDNLTPASSALEMTYDGDRVGGGARKGATNACGGGRRGARGGDDDDDDDDAISDATSGGHVTPPLSVLEELSQSPSLRQDKNGEEDVTPIWVTECQRAAKKKSRATKPSSSQSFLHTHGTAAAAAAAASDCDRNDGGGSNSHPNSSKSSRYPYNALKRVTGTPNNNDNHNSDLLLQQQQDTFSVTTTGDDGRVGGGGAASAAVNAAVSELMAILPDDTSLQLPAWVERFLAHALGASSTQAPRAVLANTLEEHQDLIRELYVNLCWVFAPTYLGGGAFFVATADDNSRTSSLIVGICALIFPVLFILPHFIYMKMTGLIRHYAIDTLNCAVLVMMLIVGLTVPRVPVGAMASFLLCMGVLAGARALWTTVLVASVTYFVGSYNLAMMTSSSSSSSWSMLVFAEPRQGTTGENWVWVPLGLLSIIEVVPFLCVGCRLFTSHIRRGMFTQCLCKHVHERLCEWDLEGVARIFEAFHSVAVERDLVFPVYMSNIIRSIGEFEAVLPVDLMVEIAENPCSCLCDDLNLACDGDDDKQLADEEGQSAAEHHGNDNSGGGGGGGGDNVMTAAGDTAAERLFVVSSSPPDGDGRETNNTATTTTTSLPHMAPMTFSFEEKKSKYRPCSNPLALKPVDEVTVMQIEICPEGGEVLLLENFDDNFPAVQSLIAVICRILDDHRSIILEVQEHNIIIAQWGAPRKCEAACALACCAALHIQAASRRHHHSGAVSKSRQKLLPLTVNIGIHHGPALVGSIGSSSRRAYTAIGQAPTVASALCRLNNQVPGCFVIASNEVVDSATDYLCKIGEGRAFATQWLSSVRLAGYPSLANHKFLAIQLLGVIPPDGGVLATNSASSTPQSAAPLGTSPPETVQQQECSSSAADLERVAMRLALVTASFTDLIPKCTFDQATLELLCLLDSARAAVEQLELADAASKYAQACSARSALPDISKARLHRSGVTKATLVSLSAQCSLLAKRRVSRSSFQTVMSLSDY